MFYFIKTRNPEHMYVCTNFTARNVRRKKARNSALRPPYSPCTHISLKGKNLPLREH